MIESKMRKAAWIAKQLDENVDDVHDVLLGNIVNPWEFCNSVELLANEYDRLYDEGIMRK